MAYFFGFWSRASRLILKGSVSLPVLPSDFFHIQSPGLGGAAGVALFAAALAAALAAGVGVASLSSAPGLLQPVTATARRRQSRTCFMDVERERRCDATHSSKRRVACTA